jgi:uncharacterized repeat protein (TIGR01451 family)
MGIDIDRFEVGTGYGIVPNATSVTLEFGTELDQYFPGIFSFVMKMKEPSVSLDKLVTDANNNNKAEIGEVLTYKLKGKNLGPGNAGNVVITDTLPSTVSYLPNSLRVISSPGIVAGFKTDQQGDDVAEEIENGLIRTVRFRLGTGATSSAGGMLAADETYEVEFKVTVNNPGQGKPVPSIINSARIKATSDANVEFTDDGTAIINPEAGALPVVLMYFRSSFQSNKVINTWGTSMEVNCKYFDVERSIDGNNFITVATLPGHGISSLPHDYSITDEISFITSPVIYYRLKQVDENGRKTYSYINAVRLKKSDKNFVVFPNPFNSYLNIAIESAYDEPVNIRLVNAGGAEVLRKHMQLVKGSNFIKLEELEKLLPGNYFLYIASPHIKISRNIFKQ